MRRRNLLASVAGAAASAVFGPTPAASARTLAAPSLAGLEDLLLYRQHHPLRGPDQPPPP